MVTSPASRVAFAPRVPSWQIPRSRIVDTIEGGLGDGLVIVRGPAGGGKTAAMAEWATHTPREGTWVGVRADTIERFAFWEHVLRALDADRDADGRMRLGLGTEDQLRRALAQAFAGRSHTLVIDNYDLAADRAIDDDVTWLLGNSSCSFVLGTRTVQSFESGTLAARLGPTVVLPEVLAFDRAESTLAVTATAALPSPLADAVFDRVLGWPLGTRALAFELAHAGSDADIEVATRAVTAALTAEKPIVPASLTGSDALDVATRVAIAEWLTHDLAKALVPHAEADALLDQWEREGLGSWTDTSHGAVFTLQTFVRTALLERQKHLPRPVVAALRRAYADWADRNGNAAIAGEQALALGDWELLSDLAQRHFSRIMVVHRTEWGRILAAVPFERLRRHPALGTVFIQLLNADSGASDRIRAVATILINSVGPLRNRGSTTDQLWRNASVLAAERISGRYGSAAITVERIATLIDSLVPEEHEALSALLPVLYTHIGTTRLYNGDLVGAVVPLREALLSDVGTQWTHLHAHSLLALIAALRGDLAAADKHTHIIDTNISISGWRGTYSAAGYHLARAIVHVERFDPESAQAELSQLDRHYDTIEHWPLILHVRALIALAENLPSAAAAMLPDQIRVRSKRTSTSAWMKALMASTHSDLLLAAGEMGAATLATAQLDDATSPSAATAAARAALASGDYARAIALTNRLIGHKGASPRTLADALLVRTVSRHQSGHPEDAAISLRQAIGVLDQYGLRMPLALVPRDSLVELLPYLDSATRLSAETLFVAVPSRLETSTPPAKLSSRELAVLAELTHEPSTQAIAASLFVSPNTVKSQIRSIYRKLGVSTRGGALAVAETMGLLPRE